MTPYGAPLAAMRPGYRRILAYQRSWGGVARPPYRYFRVNGGQTWAAPVVDRRYSA